MRNDSRTKPDEVAEFMRAFAARDETGGSSVEVDAKRRAQLIWFEAQLRRACAAERRALLPIRIWQGVSVGIFVGGISVALAAAGKRLAAAPDFLSNIEGAVFAPLAFQDAGDAARLLPLLLVIAVCLCAFNLILLRRSNT